MVLPVFYVFFTVVNPMLVFFLLLFLLFHTLLKHFGLEGYDTMNSRVNQHVTNCYPNATYSKF